MSPFIIELRDPAGGAVLARSYNSADCLTLLRRLASRKHREALDLAALAPVSAAALRAEERRLLEIASLVRIHP
jgi:hypothetical protein